MPCPGKTLLAADLFLYRKNPITAAAPMARAMIPTAIPACAPGLRAFAAAAAVAVGVLGPGAAGLEVLAAAAVVVVVVVLSVEMAAAAVVVVG